MDALNKKKRTIKGYITRAKSNLESVVSQQVGGVLDIKRLCQLEEHLENYNKYASQLEALVNEMISLADENDANFAAWEKQRLDEVASVTNTTVEFAAEIKTFRRLILGAQARESLVSSEDLNASFRLTPSNGTSPRLEKIPVPKFDGEFVNFPNWKGMFDNLVHENTNLLPVQKLHYLKESLKDGNAFRLVRDFPITEAAYAEAYAVVNSRYNNKRALIRNWFRKLNNLPLISSNTKIGSLIDEVDSIVCGLKVAGEKIDDTFSRYIAYLVATRLDKRTAEDWEHSVSSTKTFPLYSELHKFIQSRLFCIEERRESANSTQPKSGSANKNVDKKTSLNTVSSPATISCPQCGENHALSSCSQFLAKNKFERFVSVKSKGLCVNCFEPSHQAKNCSASKCPKCSKPHHKLLHRNSVQSEPETTKNSDTTNKGATSSTDHARIEENAKSSYSGIVKTSRVCLLPSAVVLVVVNGKPIKARALLDACSEPNLVTESFVRKHKIPVTKGSSSITGITSAEIRSDQFACLSIKSRLNNFQLKINADVIPKIPYSVNERVLAKMVSCIDITEADFAETSIGYQDVDIIIGVEYVNLCLLGDKRFIEGLWLEKSQFGWISSGSTDLKKGEKSSQFCSLITDVQDQLRKFWEVEEIELPKIHLMEHELIEKHFEENVRRLENGKFSVSLPFKNQRSLVANTYKQARSALFRSERISDCKIREGYSKFLNEYLALGHMELVSSYSSKVIENRYFMPHHAVLRGSSSTTPLRVVFNASAKNESGLSLNETLMVGPKLQPDLFDLLVKFRSYTVAFVADISKMYRCIMVNEEDRDMQSILWRSEPSQPVSIYRLTTVTYGTAPASYLATKCLQKLAADIKSQHPEAAHSIEREFYMDDLMTGGRNDEEAIRKRKVIHETLAEAKMPLRKYASNSKEFLRSIDSSLVDEHRTVILSDERMISLLGLKWNPVEDEFAVKINLPEVSEVEPITKRKLSSVIARVFDPLGLMSPVTIVGKLMLQSLWREELEWDTAVPESISNCFFHYVDNLRKLEEFTIPRLYSAVETTYQLVGFSDASEKAYSAVVYLRRASSLDKEASSVLVCSKTRVAPIKTLTIPRLELMGAVCLVKLISKVQGILKIETQNIHCFCDSTIVLAWIKNSAEGQEVFVRNRASFIASQLPFHHWNFVRTNDNPADLCTRGINAETLIEKKWFWLKGPNWMIDNFEDNVQEIAVIETNLESKKVSFVSENSISPDYIDRFSSYLRCLRVTAYVLRFISKCNQTHKLSRKESHLEVSELHGALKKLIYVSQRKSFNEEIRLLEGKQPLSTRSPLSSLAAYLDEDGILRVGGRLSNSNQAENRKHPVILHKGSRLLKLYVEFVHLSLAHASLSIVLNLVHQRYWIVGGSERIVKKVISRCIRCIRMNATPSSQFMGELPAARVNISRPFTHTGVDLTGFFQVKCVRHRSTKFEKAYAAFFVCFATKAIHIELVSDLSTDAFLAAFNRFVSRRGLPTVVYSDNATNFVGAANTLRVDWNQVAETAANKQIDWSFIPPQSPHHGGLWEAAVKSGKALLKKVIGDQILDREELETLLIRVEAILNSRPLCRGKERDPLNVITPAHFLVGGILLEPEIRDDRGVKLGRRYELTQQLARSFWKRWSEDYLLQLQRRVKWKNIVLNIEVGDVVLVRRLQTHSLGWPLGVVTSTYPDSSGVVRVVDVKLATGTLRRCVQHLVKLPTDEA